MYQNQSLRDKQRKGRILALETLPVGFLFVCMTPAVGSSLLLSPLKKILIKMKDFSMASRKQLQIILLFICEYGYFPFPKLHCKDSHSILP